MRQKGTNPMTTRPLLAAAIAGATLLAGCGTPNRGLESVHQPVVARADYALDVQTGSAGIGPDEARRVIGWMDTLRIGYGDTIALDDPYGADRATRGDVAQIAARYGLLLSDEAPVTGSPVAPGTVRIVVSRAHASVPGCADWSRMNDPNFNAHTGSNYGCATNTNLAAMVANPTDLVRGAPGSGDYDAATGSRAINTMRAAVPTGNGGTWVKNQADSTGEKK